MTFENNPTRIPGEPVRTPPVEPRRSGYGSFGLLAAIAAVVLLGLIFFGNGDTTNTASTATERSAPTTSAPPPGPGPAK